MGVLDGFKRGFQHGIAIASVDQKSVSSSVMATWQNQKPSYPTFNFDASVRHGYKKNELIFACITLKADSASIPRMVVKDSKTKDVIENHPLRDLMMNPNPFMTEFDFFSATLTFLDLAGVSYWEKVRSNRNKVVELWPLRPDWVRPIKDSDKFVSAYQYGPPGLQPATLKPDDVLVFKTFDPINMYQGLAPVQVAARMGDVDNSSTDFVKLFFEKGGTPPGLLTVKEKLIESQVEEIRRRWRQRYGGFENWIDPVVLDSDADFKKIGLTFQEMGFEFLDARSEARICMCLRTPPILVGATIGLQAATYSNYEAARTAFWQDTLGPQYKRLSDRMNNSLANEFGGNVFLEWDFSDVPALQKDLNDRWKRATAALQAGGITVNQFLEEVGKPKTEYGDVYVRELRTIEVPFNNVRPINEVLGTVRVNPDENVDNPIKDLAEQAVESGEATGIPPKPYDEVLNPPKKPKKAED